MINLGNSDQRSQAQAIKLALAVALGAAGGASVYALAESWHAKHHAPVATTPTGPPPSAATEAAPKPLDASAAPAKPAAADAAAAEAPTPKQEPAPSPEPDDPKARALAERNAAEQALLDTAREQLEADKPAAAQATLERMKRRFPRGALVQVRELLRIEIYKARSQLPAAKRAARKFAKTYPDSPHLGALESLLDDSKSP